MRPLTRLSEEEFVHHLCEASSEARALDEGSLHALHLHYEELRRWSPRVDLIGPGAADEIFARHYGEALAALPLLPAPSAARPLRLLDLGSGAGFPGLILAAARTDAEVWLVEPRERRAAFLAAVLRRAQLAAVRVVNARVAPNALPPLPANLTLVTLRALRLDPRTFRALLPHLAPDARFLFWSGGEAPAVPPELVAAGTLELAGSRQRRIREYRVVGVVGVAGGEVEGA
jgi:16S rRNA (guanine527-N7)-methyltransferase